MAIAHEDTPRRTFRHIVLHPGAEVPMNRKFVKTLLMAVAVTACSEGSDLVAPAPQGGLVSSTGVAAVQAFSPRASDVTVTQTIGANGGTISGGGVTLSIPAGALSADTEISMTVPAGKFLEVQFAPHGLQFSQPATLSFGLAGTAAANARVAGSLAGMYFDGDLASGNFRALETFDVRVKGATLSYDISHFSGYCVVSGMDADDRCRC